MPVAAEVAHALHTPLEVCVARKIGAPGRPELGIGAIAEGGVQVIDQRAVDLLGVTRAHVLSVVAAEQTELERRVRHYRGDRALPEVARGHSRR